MTAFFSYKTQITDSLWTFFFTPEAPLRYIAGQFIELHLPHKQPDLRGENRWFTLSSAPHETELAITTSIQNDGSSYKATLVALQPGDAVTVSQSLGDFVLPKNEAIPLLFVAGGIGATPFRSIIEDSLARNERRTIEMIYVVRNIETAAFTETFTKLADSLTMASSSNALNLLKPSGEHYTYVAGPEQFVEDVVTYLVGQNIQRSQIYTDFFHGYSPVM